LDKLDDKLNQQQEYIGIDMVEQLSTINRAILTLIEEMMNYVAPNLSQIVGGKLAANLMGIAGGLTNLAKMSHT